MRILFAEDDVQLRSAIARGLRDHAYTVEPVADGDAALRNAAMREYDALVLDVLLPQKTGVEVCGELRRRGNHVPILLLTALDSVRDRVRGLDAGADDYLVKPFAFDELLARLRAIVRRPAACLPRVMTVGDLTIDSCSQTATRNGRTIPLTPKEYALLEYLAREKGRVLSRADISAHVWDASLDPVSNTIEVYVNRLRVKLGAPGEDSRIRTLRGAGYVLLDS